MGHTCYEVYEHIVFSTKYRQKLLDKPVQKELFPYLAAAIRNQDCRCLIVGGEIEHIHLLVGKSSMLLTVDLVKEIKRTSSIWIKSKGEALRGFYWQVGFGAFSVSYSNLGEVKAYILQQERHHREMNWEQEYRVILRKHGVKFDKWDFLD